MESYEWKFDGAVKYRIVEVHVDTIRPGDTVLLSDGILHTVGKKDISYNPFMGTSSEIPNGCATNFSTGVLQNKPCRRM